MIITRAKGKKGRLFVINFPKFKGVYGIIYLEKKGKRRDKNEN